MSNLLTPRVRMSIMMTVFIYPVVTAYLYILAPLTPNWTLWQRTLILVPLMVVTITYAVVPAINRYFSGFVSARASAG